MTEEVSSKPAARAYQVEMYNESLQRNIIVAMDTGSGKTLIAIERIRAQLLSSTANKIIWFMCPGVALAHQQSEALRQGLGEAYLVKSLTGNDKVDTWKNQRIWDDALLNVNVIVCTYQVLLDALIHGFVHLSDISLLVFDEAHHCTGKHAAARIMQQFYHPQKKEQPALALPVILGLSASPVTKQRSLGLTAIEQNLDAIARTPCIHRAELFKHVNRPILSVVEYSPYADSCCHEVANLAACYDSMDINEDPYVVQHKGSEALPPSYAKTLLKRDTYSQRHIRSFLRAARTVETELGVWAAQIYMWTCLSIFNTSSSPELDWLEGEDSEKAYMRTVLAPLSTEQPALPSLEVLSSKVVELVYILVEEMKEPNTNGIIFVETRAQVYVLSLVLNSIAETKDLVRTVTFVGASTHQSRKGMINELADARHNDSAVEELRSGRKNLIISTSVCEEGIDISACNLVICFQSPPNLRSFIQRRGRARAMDSKYIIMLEANNERNGRIAQFKELEAEMEAEYMDQMRELKELERLESEEDGYRELVVENTGSHSSQAYHFCNNLTSVSHTTLVPTFIFTEYGIGDGKLFSCKVELPNCLDATLRTYQSRDMWRSQKMARTDAAFEAYAALKDAGLVDNHLLPGPHIDEDAARAYEEVAKRPSMVQVEEQLNPWQSIARLWSSALVKYWTYQINIVSIKGGTLTMNMLAPRKMPVIPKIALHIDHATTVIVQITECEGRLYNDHEMLNPKAANGTLLRSVYNTRMDKQSKDFPVLFVPSDINDLQAWTEHMSGQYAATTLVQNSPDDGRNIGILRTTRGKRFIFHDVEIRPPDDTDNVSAQQIPHLKCTSFPKRSDFLHPAQGQAPAAEHFEYLRPEDCTVDNLSLRFATFARMVPALLHCIGLQIVVEDLCQSLLAPVGFSNSHLVQIATTAASSHEGYDYQRFELIGDTVLKVLTAVTLMEQYPKWHEGYLSRQKDHIVSNGRLGLAAQQAGLAKYITTKQFTAHKYKPMSNSDLLNFEAKTRNLTTKTLADVVEALIGAAYVDGGFPKALVVLQIFLPEVKWRSLDELHANLQSRALSSVPSTIIPTSPLIIRLETLLKYNFNNKALLLEAVTHPSLTTSTVPSYQRLEFLGDCVLDYLVTKLIFSHESRPSVPRMHRLRAATVNAAYLSYCALSTIIEIPGTKISSLSPITRSEDSPLEQTTTNLSLLSFLLESSSNPSLDNALKQTVKRYNLLKPQLDSSLAEAKQYPWRILAAFNPEKTVSDIVEAVLGAVWVDSDGAGFETVEHVARHLGLLKWLDRALEEDVRCWHPKEEVGIFGGLGSANKPAKGPANLKDEKDDEKKEKEKSGVDYLVWQSPDLRSTTLPTDTTNMTSTKADPETDADTNMTNNNEINNETRM